MQLAKVKGSSDVKFESGNQPLKKLLLALDDSTSHSISLDAAKKLDVDSVTGILIIIDRLLY